MERPEAGRAVEMEDGVRMVLASNPSPMTYWGTNTWIVGTSEVCVIDPGPDDPVHLKAILSAVAGARVSHILVTHAHLDHSPLADRLSRKTGAPVLAFGDAASGRSGLMERLAREGLAGGGEGVDTRFAPAARIAEGDRIEGAGWSLEVIHTPGHFASHLAFALDDQVFTGDHVMGWASSLVSPPDGDLTAFMATCAKLKMRQDRVFYPGHGAPVLDPQGRLDWLVAHRKSREAAILRMLGSAPLSLGEITRRVYTDVTPAMLPAAERNVLAHLIDLAEKGVVVAEPELSLRAAFLRLPDDA